MSDLLTTLEAAVRSPRGLRLVVPDPQAFRAVFDAAVKGRADLQCLSLRISPYNPSEVWVLNGKD